MAPSNHDPDYQLPNSSNAIISQQDCTNTRKNGRGRTIGLGVSKKKKKSATGKLHVDIPADKMVANGPGAANFVTEVSIVVLKNAPFNVKKWGKIPQAKLDKIVSKVLDTFDIDNTTHNNDVILETAKRLYRNHRCRFHQHFSQYNTNEIALKHKPEDISEEDWKFLVDYFSSPDYKAISERNKVNKAKQVIKHRCGRKSFQAVSYDARDPETQKEPNFQDLWRMTHTNSNGEWKDDASKEIHTKVEEACSELATAEHVDCDKDMLANIAFKSVVGERSGYSRGLGAGIKPQKRKAVTGLHEELKKECEKRHDMEMKLKDVETQLQEERKMREEMTAKFEESQRQIGEEMEKQVEAKMANMFRQMLNFQGGQSSGALTIESESNHRANNMTTDKPSSNGVSTTSQRKVRSKYIKKN
ncbi:uncharacterized protein LOC123897932 [Trifolium pratense]|uniref:Uncharacterized protein n=2 Tax=Trifolium pratense TaxID=57577 RepID=A0ACB0M1R7_TRIPR|nr:uncharacterized protein LOC123897932 [Trifolium pratense]CAJ2673382.1 unnamed protein product [Trifolium pratense]